MDILYLIYCICPGSDNDIFLANLLFLYSITYNYNIAHENLFEAYSFKVATASSTTSLTDLLEQLNLMHAVIKELVQSELSQLSGIFSLGLILVNIVE